MAAIKEAKVPDIGNYKDVPVIEWLVAVGDTVKPEQGLLSLESDKATMEVPAPFGGVVRELKVKVGDSVSEGTVVALIEDSAATPAEAAAARPAAAPEASAPEPAKSPEPVPAVPAPAAARPAADLARATASPPIAFDSSQVMPQSVPYASPGVRAFARELGVDLAQVSGSERKGRIGRADVSAFVKSSLAAAPATRSSASAAGGGLNLLPWPVIDFARFGEIEAAPLSRIKNISGANLARNWAMIPHVTQHDLADITELEAFRKKLAEENKDLKVTPLVFQIKALVAALKKFPQFNASLDASGENLILKKYFHVGIAVDTPEGLVVPVIRDCDRKGLLDLAGELGTLSAKARDRKLGPAQMSGGCISISSLGGIGGTAFTPIVNAPEVAILGVSKAAIQPVWDGKEFKPRLLLPLSLSYDHRVIDGADAARFTAYLAQQLGDIRRLLL